MINKKLQQKIIRLARKDQDIRWKIIKKGIDKKREVYKCDFENLKEIKKIINKYGWPTFNLIGKRSSNLFWLLVQHADLDPKFQQRCLRLLEQAVKDNQAHLKNLAYLTDRVLVGKGKKQKFGTQFCIKNGEYISKPIFDRKNVDKRRKEFRLNTLKEYQKGFNKRHKKYIKSLNKGNNN